MKKQAMRGHRGFTLIEIMIVVLIIGILLSIAVPNFARARDTARTKACIQGLYDIERAKEQWAMENNQPTTATPVGGNLAPDYLRSVPQCSAGGVYTIGNINTLPTCSLGGAHTIN